MRLTDHFSVHSLKDHSWHEMWAWWPWRAFYAECKGMNMQFSPLTHQTKGITYPLSKKVTKTKTWAHRVACLNRGGNFDDLICQFFHFLNKSPYLWPPQYVNSHWFFSNNIVSLNWACDITHCIYTDMGAALYLRRTCIQNYSKQIVGPPAIQPLLK